MAFGISKKEEKKIIEEAISLLREPADFITGQWKCEIWATDEKGRFLKDEHGHKIQARDLHNRPMAQYCIEGAVNQAAVNVLGKERSVRLGVSRDDSEMTDALGLNEIARSLFPDYECAQDVNDSFKGREAEGHAAVLGILKTKLKNLRSRKKVMAAA